MIMVMEMYRFVERIPLRSVLLQDCLSEVEGRHGRAWQLQLQGHTSSHRHLDKGAHAFLHQVQGPTQQFPSQQAL